jgi:hypothetical protein
MGSLKNYLHNNTLSRGEIIRVIKGTAAGINHLHQENIGMPPSFVRNVEWRF